MHIEHAAALAARLMAEHGLTAAGWHFAFNNHKTALGVCHYTAKTVFLSRPLTEINDDAEVEDTILHEIAHALAGPAAGHGKEWRSVAAAIGATPERASSTAAAVPPKWLGVCPTAGCAWTSKRHRLTNRAQRLACPFCCDQLNYGKWSARFQLVWVPADSDSGKRITGGH